MQLIKQDRGKGSEKAMEGRAATSSRDCRLRSSNHTALTAATQPPETIHSGEADQPTSDQDTGDLRTQIH
ncbi:hypothetical protein OAH76_04445 [Verrucomicrobia bacterium]|nr:hypothetical protein [Verrucomicrobiota bacterium]MDB4804094.1 hypothetical protein [Verrucomicrobiota bacterium]